MKRIWFAFVISIVLGGACLFGALVFVVHNQVVDFSPLERYNNAHPSILLDAHGHEWGRFTLERRNPIELAAIPVHVQKAFLAAEDRDFFNHPGLSFRSILRSMMVNMLHGRAVQGASTITQQLVKLLFTDCSRTFRRKLKEQLLAIAVERQFTKEQILQTYLNHVYFGRGIYGVEAAAQRFWGKSVRAISPAQAAVLATIIRNPLRYNPLLAHSPDAVLGRRNFILQAMVTIGALTQAQCTQAQHEPLAIIEHDNEPIASHVKEHIRVFLEKIVGKNTLYTGGYIIQTTISRPAQETAQKLFTAQFEQLKKTLPPSVDGSLLSMDSHTGAIRALIGGYNFGISKFDRALIARRQMGSVFKPLIYATALMQGRSFDEVDIDEPTEFHVGQTTWNPKNSTDKFEGPMTLANALSISNNIIAIKTLLRTGIEPVVDLAKKCHLGGDLSPRPSLALGCTDVTLKESVASFNVFANDGVYVEPYIIEWVKDSTGKRIYTNQPVHERVISSRVAGQVGKVLGISLKRYLARTANVQIDMEAMCKTGTTNDSRTCWFIGATPSLTTGLYLGCDGNQTLGHDVYPLWTIFPVWHRFNQATAQDQTKHFVVDPSLQEARINLISGKPAAENDPESTVIYR